MIQIIHKKTLLLTLFILSLNIMPIYSDIIGDSMTLFDKGDRNAAVLLLKNWLTENPNHSDYTDVYTVFLSLQPSVNELLDELNGEINYFSALTAEMRGDFSLARDQFLKLASQTGDEQTEINYKLDASEMALLLGNINIAKQEVNLLLVDAQGHSLERSILLLTRIMILEGMGPRAIKILEKSLNSAPSIDGLFLLTDFRELSSIPMEDFQTSPESLIISNEILRTQTPFSLGLTDGAFHIGSNIPRLIEVEIPSSEYISQDIESNVLNHDGKIQAGSFLFKDNADELETVLSDLDWDISIVETTRNNKIYYQVLIINLNPDSINDELLKLKSKGFDGFILR